MMLTKPSLALTAVILFLLAVAPVYAAPSLSLGSTAKYDLAATATVTTSCTSDPVTFAYQACTGITPPTPPPVFGPAFLSDNFTYSNVTQMRNAGWGIDPSLALSYFSFGNSTVTFKNDGNIAPGASWTHIPANTANWSVSTRVAFVGNYYGTLQLNLNTVGHYYTWEARGTYDNFGLGRYYPGQPCCDVVANASSYFPQLNVWHILRADMLNNVISGYFDNNLILTYTEPDTTPGDTALTSIGIQGAFLTYDSYDWIVASPISQPPPPILPPPAPKTVQVDLSGNVGWTAEGLSPTRANLVVSHNIAVSVPLGIFSFTPITESGSFPQSIDLSTRQESPGTATSLLKAILSATLPATSGLSVPSSPSLSTMLENMNGPDYTMWWVDGPLSNGSPVQIMQGWSTVTGSESLNLGSTLGTRNAWIVTSEVTQTVNTSVPNVSNPLGSQNISNTNLDLSLLWSFDKTADLLLRNNDTISLTMHSSTSFQIGSLLPCTVPICTICPQGVCPTVNVIRDTSIRANLTLLLSSTSLKLNGQGTASPAQTPTLMQSLASLRWIPMGVAGLLAGGIAGLAILISRKTKRNIPPVAPATWPGPNSQPS